MVDNIDLTLTPGLRYAAVVDPHGAAIRSLYFEQNQNSYNQGNASWFGVGGDPHPVWWYLNSTYNTEFRAEFQNIPEPGSFLLAGVVACALARYVRRAKLQKPH